MEKHISNIHKIIKLAKNYLKENNLGPETEGYIYFCGPKVSDLVVVSINKALKAKEPKAKKCTDEEWNEYFYKHICQHE